MRGSSIACLLATYSVGSSLAANILIPRHPIVEESVAVSPSEWKRATPQAPNGYTPEAEDCPSVRPTIRSASGLSPEERSWLQDRRNNTIWAMRDLLNRMKITGLDTNSYIDSHSNNASALPNIGIALSGGGYRALMNGAGSLAAFDNRTANSTSQGHLGGLLQAATYLSGLSGGGWLVGSLYVNNFTSVQAIVNTDPDASGSLWQFENSVFEGPDQGSIQLLDSAEYWNNLYDTVGGKADAGYNTSLTDYWGRGLSYQLVNASEGGPAYTWSSIADDVEFSAGRAPMPILVADGRAPGELLIPANTTVFEFNPWELGTWDPTVYGFAPLRYVGTNFSEGVVPDDQQCVRGFDNAGFVMGTSSSLFNQFLLNLNSSDIPDIFMGAVKNILENLGDSNNDIAEWSPNPFYHYHNATNLSTNSTILTLVDGGEDLQNIPLNPLIQPVRHVDVIFAVDSSADTSGPGANWPNGTALVATYERSLNPTMQNKTAFPAIPDQNTFVNLGLNNRPTFFGCSASNMTGPAPLIVYIPNTPYIFNSNLSTFDFPLSYNISERNVVIENGYNVATQGNSTRDANWPACVGCAILSRSLTRTGTEVPQICRECFDKYCWDGTLNSTAPTPYQPEIILTQTKLAIGARDLIPSLLAVGVATIVSLMLNF